MTARERIYRWLNERLDLDGVIASLSRQRVPVHRWSFFNALGGMTLILLGIQVASGVLLLLYYRPSVETAHPSVAHIIGEVPFGDLVRSVHAWSSDLFVGFLLAHVFSVVIQRSYRAPRELLWLSGTGLFVMCIGLAFSGHLLPWTGDAYVAARVSTELAAGVPGAGHFMKVFLRGGEEITATSLNRFFGFHVAILPPVVTVLLVMHLWLVRRQGVSVPESVPPERVRMLPYWPHMGLRVLARATALVLLVLTAAVFLPRDLAPEADPLAATPPDVRPQWYFVWVFQVIKRLPSQVMGFEGHKLGVTALVLALGCFVALPIIDRRGSRLMFYLGCAALVAFVGATLHGLM